MKRVSKSIPMFILIMSFIFTAINILITFWFPVIIPFSSFVSVRLSVLGIVTGHYWLIVIAILGCALIGITILSIKNDWVFIPTIFSVYLIADLVVLFPLFIQSVCAQYSGMWLYTMHIIIDVVTIVSIIVYIRNVKEQLKM